MEKKKSRFQQRLEEMAKKFKEENPAPGDTDGHKVKPQKRRTEPGREWIPIDAEKPPYYSPIDILVCGEEELYNWHRVSDGEKDYYCNSIDDNIRRFVTHWAKRPGVEYHPYEPLTIMDVIILKLKHELIPDDGRPLDDDELGFNTGINRAIDIINKHHQGT